MTKTKEKKEKNKFVVYSPRHRLLRREKTIADFTAVFQMPKRVHSASDRDDETPHPNASKRTRKASDLVTPFATVVVLIDHSFFFRRISAKNFTIHFDRINLKMENFSPNIFFVCRAKGSTFSFLTVVLILVFVS